MSNRDGRSKTRLYRIWWGMKSRCCTPSDGDYSNYGARGIRVCDAWLASFDAFKDWALANGYTDELTIDRVDVNGPYSPENCRWATVKEQSRNRQNTLFIAYNGVTKSASEWAEQLGVSLWVIHSRYRRNGTPYTSKQLEGK